MCFFFPSCSIVLLLCISHGFLLSTSHCVKKNIRDWGKGYLYLEWAVNIFMLRTRRWCSIARNWTELVFFPLSSCTFCTWHRLLLPSAFKCDLMYQGCLFCLSSQQSSTSTIAGPPSIHSCPLHRSEQRWLYLVLSSQLPCSLFSSFILCVWQTLCM